MIFYVLGYELPGNIYKNIWNYKESMFRKTMNSSWIYYPSFVICKVYRELDDYAIPLQRHSERDTPIYLNPPAQNRYSAMEMSVRDTSSFTADTAESPKKEYHPPLIPIEHPGILLGALSEQSPTPGTALELKEGIHFFPNTAALWEVDASDTPCPRFVTRVISRKPVRKRA